MTAFCLAGCGADFDGNAYCAEVKRARQPADLAGDDAAVADYLAHVRKLEQLAPRDAREDWKSVGDGIAALMRDGAVDQGRLDQAQRRLTDMAGAAERLDESVRGDCGFGLSGP
jgi:hypothetical protein